MSIDFIALIDVTIEGVSPEWMLSRVQRQPAIFAHFVTKYGHYFRMQAWSVEPLHAPEANLVLVGPGGFVVHFRDQMIELWHGIRFSMFTGDPWHRDALRHVCYFIAGTIGSARAVYTHECMPYGT